MLQNEKHKRWISRDDVAPITQGMIEAARHLPEKP
jgi:hypothetical protein